jgi:hypothetical protein
VPQSSESLVAEELVADVSVRYVEIERDGKPWFYAAAAPVADEWCYLADADDLHELELGARAILGDETTRGILVRCAALMGIPWSEDLEIVPILDEQMRRGMELLVSAPGMAEADPEQLRRLRDLP